MTIRIAVMGVGRIGRMHAELLAHRVEGAELAMVQDVNETAATRPCRPMMVERRWSSGWRPGNRSARHGRWRRPRSAEHRVAELWARTSRADLWNRVRHVSMQLITTP